MKLVHVTWQDAGSGAKWTRQKTLDVVEAETVGWLIAENETRIVVCGERNDRKQWSNRTAIPRGCILKVKELRGK